MLKVNIAIYCLTGRKLYVNISYHSNPIDKLCSVSFSKLCSESESAELRAVSVIHGSIVEFRDSIPIPIVDLYL